MKINILHGDQVIRKLSNPIKGDLDPATDLVIAGSHSSPHTIRGNVLTRSESDVRFVRVESDTVIDHADRHKTVQLPAGDYVIYPQRERGGDGDRAVED